MISKKAILLWICKLDDEYDSLDERLTKIEKIIKSSKKGTKNGTN